MLKTVKYILKISTHRKNSLPPKRKNRLYGVNNSKRNSTITINNIHSFSREDEQMSEYEVFDMIDFTGLEHIGFKKKHINYCRERKLISPELLQRNLNHFAFELKMGIAPKFKTTPLNYIYGINQAGKPYRFPKGYKSPGTERSEDYLRELKEDNLYQEQIDKETYDHEFKKWARHTTTDQMNIAIPGIDKMPEGEGKLRVIKMHFKTSVWTFIEKN